MRIRLIFIPVAEKGFRVGIKIFSMKSLLITFFTLSILILWGFGQEAKPKDAVSKIQNNRIMFLNAYNFDFGSTALSSNYVGHLNLFAPTLEKDDKSRTKWGFNTGIMKISYGQKDTSQTREFLIEENIYANPFDTLGEGVKYLRQINGYKTEKKNTIWSFYVQPVFELTSATRQHIYVHAHLELLASKWSSTTTISNKFQDTALYSVSNKNLVIRRATTNSSTYTINSLSGYFGAGFTFDLRPWTGGGFFFQPTVGFTSNSPSPSSVDINTSVRFGSNPRSGSTRNWNSFYLVRAYYTHVINEATIIVGTDIRGLLPLYAPQYAAYVGLNLPIDSILGLIGGTKKDEAEKNK